MAFIQLDTTGRTIGFGAIAQDMTQGHYAGGSQIEVADDDPRIGTYVAAQVAVPPPRPTPRQWLERLSPATQSAITAAAAKDASGALLLWMLKAAGNPAIDVTSAETVQGVGALVAAGIITAADQAALLAP